MIEILQGDCIERLRDLPDNSVQMCVTSPPYWGLRNYNCEGQIGLESSVDAYLAAMVEVFREVRRVLRPDGVLWLNLGDTYAASRSYQVPDNKHGHPIHAKGAHRVPMGFKPKDLIGIPWRVAFALQADGWYLRSDIIWEKPNAMPESVRDRPTKAHEYIFLLTKSERYFYDHEAIKEPASPDTHPRYARGRGENHKYSDGGPGNQTLARSMAHMLPPGVNPKAKMEGRNSRMHQDRDPAHPAARKTRQNASFSAAVKDVVAMRNKRTVWRVATQAVRDAHFATYPQKLIEPCILAGTPAAGSCPQCGTPWRRIQGESVAIEGRSSGNIERKVATLGERSRTNTHMGSSIPWSPTATPTIGWRQSCACPANEPVPAVVLDPFFGAGTTGLVAAEHGRRAIGIELNPDYIEIARKRLGLTERDQRLLKYAA